MLRGLPSVVKKQLRLAAAADAVKMSTSSRITSSSSSSSSPTSGLTGPVSTGLVSAITTAGSGNQQQVAVTQEQQQQQPYNQVLVPRNGVDYRGKVVLAPMVRSGELPMRLVSLKYGADLVWGPETIDKAIAGATRKVCPRTNTVFFTRLPSHGSSSQQQQQSNPNVRESVIYRIHPQLEGRKLVFQLGTAAPDLAVQAARVVAADVAGIDVNSGCPKPFSTLGGMGAALLKDPDRLCAILEALVRDIVPEFQIGISVKIRILENPQDTEALVRRLVATGITGLTVHCRTTPMRPRERAIRDQMRMIADICRAAGVACLMNGDVASYDDAVALAAEYGCDGGMIATAAEQNPTVFRAGVQGGPMPRGHVVREYIETAMRVDNRWGNTKFSLAQVMPLKDPRGPVMQRARCHEDLVRALGFEDLVEMAREVDARMGMSGEIDPTSKAGKKALRRAAAAEKQQIQKHTQESLQEQERKQERKQDVKITKRAQTDVDEEEGQQITKKTRVDEMPVPLTAITQPGTVAAAL